MSCSKLGPRTPSLGSLVQKSNVPFSDYAELDLLLSETVVGDFRHRDSLLILRAASRTLRNSIDASIAIWCSKFSTCQRGRATKSKNTDEFYSSVVEAEIMVDNAFGSLSGTTRGLLDVSVVNKATFLCALTNRCVLCGEPMTRSVRPVVEEDVESCIVPRYVFAHRSCIRKHLVMLTDGNTSIQRGTEPRSLHRELSAVSQMNPKNIVITKESVMNAMSAWYKVAYASRLQFGPQLVWLRPHPLVRTEDTLYGAMKITNEEVKQSVMAANAHSNEMALQASVRRKSVVSRVEQHTNHCIADLRLWLGKGHTRWRSVEDLEGFHKNIMSSIGFLSAENPCGAGRRVVCGNMNTVYNVLLLLDKTLSRVTPMRASYVTDWVVSSLRVDQMFDNDMNSFSPFSMAFIPSDDPDGTILAEVTTVADIINSIAGCRPEDISVAHFAKTGPVSASDDLPKYKASVNVYLRDHYLMFDSKLVISHMDICKLKHVVLKFMDHSLASTIPSVPPMASGTDVKATEQLFSAIVKACFHPRAGGALSKGLSLLVNAESFTQLKDAIQYTPDEYYE